MPVIKKLPWKPEHLIHPTDYGRVVLGASMARDDADALEVMIVDAIHNHSALSELKQLAVLTASDFKLQMPDGKFMSVAVEAYTHRGNPGNIQEDSMRALELLQTHVPQLMSFQQVPVDSAMPGVCPEIKPYSCSSYSIRA